MNTVNNNKREISNNYIIIYRKRKMWITFFLMLFSFTMTQAQDNEFLDQQLNYDRVEEAFDLKENMLKEMFAEQNLSWPPQEIYLRSFKAEAVLEVWVKSNDEFKLFNVYPICKNSGNFGPKRKEGDGQVPEGLYAINRFNPVSSCWLSLGINYPNESDDVISDDARPGSDIFIHGNCVTIGCLPMTNDKIKEIYVLAVLAKNQGQEDIPVHMFPFEFNTLNVSIFSYEFPEHKEFWNNLRAAYDYFEEHGQPIEYSVNSAGLYIYD